MQICVEHAEAERIAEKIGDNVRAEDRGYEAFRFEKVELHVIVTLEHAEVACDAGTFEILHRQDALTAKFPVNLGHSFGRRVRGIIAQDLGVGCFAPVIEFVERPSGELSHGIAHEIKAADAEKEDDPDSDSK